jgi:hypothetical protein
MTDTCPRCGGSGQVLVDVIPKYMQGNIMDLPLYERCTCGAAEARDRLVQQVAEEQGQRRRAEADAYTAAEQRLRAVAKTLHERHAAGRAYRTQWVDTTGWGPFKTEHYDMYEPAWPVGKATFDFPETHTSGRWKGGVSGGCDEGGRGRSAPHPLSGEIPTERSPKRSFRMSSGVRGVQRTAGELNTIADKLEERVR